MNSFLYVITWVLNILGVVKLWEWCVKFRKLWHIAINTGTCRCTTRMDGKTVLITGATSGIGRATTFDLAKRGARLILAVRNVKLAEQMKEEIIAQTNNSNIVIHYVELSDFDSIRAFCKIINDTEPRLDVLINNAGVATLGDKRTPDGFDKVMKINHFGPFLLTNLLLDLLKKSAPSRIVTVSSIMYTQALLNVKDLNEYYEHPVFKFDLGMYSRSKLCNIFMSNELARRLSGTGVTSNAVHPGAVKTDISRYYKSTVKWLQWTDGWFLKVFGKTPEEGAQTTIHVTVCEDLANVSGEYFSRCNVERTSKFARKEVVARQVWEISEKLVGLA